MTAAVDRRPSIAGLAAPAILGSLLAAVASIVGLRAVGSLGAEALAGMLAADRVQALLQCVYTALGAGVVALVAQNWGAGNRAAAGRVLVTALQVSALVSLLLAAFVWIAAPSLLKLFGLEGEAGEAASAYFRALAIFNLAFGTFQVLSSALRARGDARSPMIATVIGALVSATAVTVLVGGAGPVPAFGVLGAALATGLSLSLSALYLLGLWRLGRTGIPFPGPDEARPVRALVRIGLPAAGQNLLFQISLSLMMFLVSRYGADAMAAYGVGVSLITLAYVFGTGFGIAAATLAGQAIGRGDPAEAARAAWKVAFCAIGCMTPMGLAAYLSSGQIAATMALGPGAAQILQTFLLFMLMVMPLMALEFSLQGALRGAGANAPAMVFTLAGLATRAGLAVAFHIAGLGLNWILFTLVLDYAVKAWLYVARIRAGGWAQRVI